ncbi:hypothetical protein RDI58_015231 [Solanum bulbocastanum]|uniref:DUF4283 domain-containing protein n=1 Tax=Solanum bulbocastanum TaxID=147425 RepID=A0AAN8TJT4_SOLBU
MKSVESKGVEELRKLSPDPVSVQLKNKAKVITEMLIENMQEQPNGYKLEYVPLSKQGEKHVVEIELDDIRYEIKFWGNVVVCYVLGAHPPFQVVKGFTQRLWGKYGIDKLFMLQNGVIVVRFESEIGKQEVLQGGIYHFDNKPFIVKEWTRELEFTKKKLHSVPIWNKLPGSDFKYWSKKGLSKIGSLIGIPLMVDHNTKEMNGLNFARLLVEVEMRA